MTYADDPYWQDTLLTAGVLPRRILAWFIDSLLIGLITASLWLVLIVFGLLTLGIGFVLLRAIWVVPIAYTMLFVASPASATPGQALMGLRVVRNDDLGRPSPAQAVVFALGFWLTMLAGVVWLAVAFFTRRNRTLHDLASGLVVIRTGALTVAGTPWNMPPGPFPR
jgi:uncharacterized RDD family membrane protein YckC